MYRLSRELGKLCRRVENLYSRLDVGKPCIPSLLSLEWVSKNFSSASTSSHCSIDLFEVQLIYPSLKPDLLCADSKVAQNFCVQIARWERAEQHFLISTKASEWDKNQSPCFAFCNTLADPTGCEAALNKIRIRVPCFCNLKNTGDTDLCSLLSRNVWDVSKQRRGPRHSVEWHCPHKDRNRDHIWAPV